MGQHFWARGYYVSTVGRDERVVREYIQQQEREDRRLERSWKKVTCRWRKSHGFERLTRYLLS